MVPRALTLLSTQVALSAFGLNKASVSSSSSPFSIANFHGPLLSASVFGDRTSHSFRTLTLSRKRSISPSTVVLSMLPTAKSDRTPDAKIPKWSASSIKAFGMGELEARKLKYPNTGTEALLLGVLVEGTSQAAKFLRENGITLFKVREETVKILGKSDMYFFSPEHPPLTEPAQRALDWAVDEKIKPGDGGDISTTHMLLGIWSEKDSAGHKILVALGFNDEKASELAKSAVGDETTLIAGSEIVATYWQ